MSLEMRGSTSRDGPSKVERGPSEQPRAYDVYSQLGQWLNEPRCTEPWHALGSFVYHPSPYRSNAGATSNTVMGTSIACKYCHKRKIRCGGKESAPCGKCQDCLRINQECIFSDTKSASTFSPHMFVAGQGQHQNHDINSFEYRASPSLTQDLYPQHLALPPSLPTYEDYRRTSLRSRTNNSDLVKAYASRGKSSGTETAVPNNSESMVNDYDVSETWKSQSASLPGKFVDEMQDREQQAPLSIPRFPVPTFIKRLSPVPYQVNPRGLDRKYDTLGESSIDDVESKLRRPPEAFKESIEPNPTRLSIRPPTPSSSPTVSSDIDVDSISGDSEGQLDRNSRGYCVFSQVFSRLAILGQKEVTARGEPSSSSSKGKQVAKGGSATSSGTRDTTSSTGGRKNRRQGDDDGDESRDRQNEPPKKKGKTSQPRCDKRSQFLACPYWKADPEKCWECFLKKNDTIAHLKQHLTRCHTPKHYCQICYQTFKSFDLCDSHVLERSCTRGPSAKLEGISQQQKYQLSLKSKGSVEQQWYTVWSILFPNVDPPATTIYISSTQSEDFCRIQEFALREGVAIMLDELESNGLIVRTDASNELLQSTIQRAMVSIFRSYSDRHKPSSDAEEPILSKAAASDHGVSLRQESATEGLIGHGSIPAISTDMSWMVEDGSYSSMVERLNIPSRSTWSQLPTTTSPISRGVVQDDTESEPWETAFLDDPAFGESSSGNDLPFNFENSEILDLDALLRDVVRTEA